MLAIITSWIIASFVFLVFGKILIDIFHTFDKNSKYGLFDIFFLGICTVGTILPIVSLWFPVNETTLLSLTLISAFYSIYLYKYKKDYFFNEAFGKLKSLPLITKSLIAVVVITIGIFSLIPPIIWDTKLYYLQAMLWNESYPVVPGLANLHGRFGFNSNFLLMSSAFSLKYIFGIRTFGLLGLSMIVFLSWIIIKITKTNSFWKKLALAFFCFGFLYCYILYVTTSSTDPLPNILVAYVLLKALLQSKNTWKDCLLIFWVLPIFSLTLKLSVAPLCLFSLWIFIELIKNKQYKTLSSVIVTALIIIVPWCIRNIILTGYLIYPFPAIDIFSFDWKIPIEYVIEEKESVSSWAKMAGITAEEFRSVPFLEWSKVWLVRYVKYLKFFLFTFCLAGVSPLLMIWLKKKGIKINTMQIVSWIIVICGSLFWYIMAPDPRFGYSFILVAGITPFLLLDIPVKKISLLSKVIYILFVAGCIYVGTWSIPLFKDGDSSKKLLSYLYCPQSIDYMIIRENTRYKIYNLGKVVLYRTNTGHCYENCFPCILADEPESLEMRGNKIEDGFRVKQKHNENK